jgi:hypothetical protein
MCLNDNLISFSIGNKLFQVDSTDEDTLTASILEFTETYTFPVLMEDRIIYAPFEYDRDVMYTHHGGYRRFLSAHSPKVRESMKTIKEVTNDNRRYDTCPVGSSHQ